MTATIAESNNPVGLDSGLPVRPRGKIKVLFMIDHAQPDGGAERLAMSLATSLPRARFELWVCATRSLAPAVADRLGRSEVPVVALGRTAKWDVHRLGPLVGLLRAQRFDILHAHKFGSNLWGSLIGSACRVPAIIAHEHSWSYEGDPIRAWLDGNVVGRLADRFVAVSRRDAERMVSVEGVDPAKIIVIPNGYIPSPASDGDVRAELGIAPGAAVVAVAAGLRPVKRLDLLLTAFAQVAAAVPDSHLVLAGDGALRSALELQARDLGLDGRVHFLGPRRDVDSILRAADVGAMASDSEGSPLFVFECMANDTPIVATSVGGIPDVVTDGENGLLVPRRDPDAMALALIELLGDADRRAAMAAAGRRALREYTLDAITSRVISLYETLAA